MCVNVMSYSVHQGCQVGIFTANFPESGIIWGQLAVRFWGWQVGIILALSGDIWQQGPKVGIFGIFLALNKTKTSTL